MATIGTATPLSPAHSPTKVPQDGPQNSRGLEHGSQFMSPGISLRSDGPVSPLPVAAKRPRCSRALVLAAVLEDMMDVNAEAGRVPDDSLFDYVITGPEDLDALLEEAAPSNSAAACAVVYAARIDHEPLPVAPENVYGIVTAALAMGAMYVDGSDSGAACARVANAARITTEQLSKLVACLIDLLPNQDTYISLASFREFQDLLNGIC
jgi:hypothetical protein